MRFTKQHALDLLKETLPYLEFCVGGTNVDETLGKVELVLKVAGRHDDFDSAAMKHTRTNYEQRESDYRPCDCASEEEFTEEKGKLSIRIIRRTR